MANNHVSIPIFVETKEENCFNVEFIKILEYSTSILNTFLTMPFILILPNGAG